MKKEQCTIPESFLRTLWETNYFQQYPLHTTTGLPVEIIRIGMPNSDSGPDFKNAKIRIGNAIYAGDIEFHVDVASWKTHRHHRDERYNQTILHVVLTGTGSPFDTSTKKNRAVPVLSLESFLPHLSQKYEESFSGKKLSVIPCEGKNAHIERSLIKSYLEKLALTRIEMKIRRFNERLKILVEETHSSIREPISRYGIIVDEGLPEEIPPPQNSFTKKDFRNKAHWEQLLYEGIFEALGYAKNREPFLRLAQIVRWDFLKQTLEYPNMESRAETIESILFAVANLTPDKATSKEEKLYLEHCSVVWQKWQQQFQGKILTATDWQFFRLHPENFPTIRIAGGSRLIAQFLKEPLLNTIISVIKHSPETTQDKIKELESLFITTSEGFWKTHYRFGAEASTPIKTFIGRDRAKEIVLNVVLPLSLLYSRMFNDAAVRNGALNLFASLDMKSTNSVIRKIQEQLVQEKFKLNTALLQQGALQLFSYYCSEGNCGECTIGMSVFKT